MEPAGVQSAFFHQTGIKERRPVIERRIRIHTD
jgi:hypothetical protein